MSDSATSRTAAHQASLSITKSWSLLKLMSIESVMPSNHLILCHPLLLLPSIFPIIRVFSNESALHIRRPKYLSFSFSIGPSSEYSGLISFRMDWLHLLASLMALLWTSTAVPSLSELSSEEQHQADCLVGPFVSLLCHSFDWWLRVIKKPPAMHLTQVRSLGPEDSLEKEMATHSRILTWRIPWTEEPGGLQSMGSQRVRHNLMIKQQHCYSPCTLCLRYWFDPTQNTLSDENNFLSSYVSDSGYCLL